MTSYQYAVFFISDRVSGAFPLSFFGSASRKPDSLRDLTGRKLTRTRWAPAAFSFISCFWQLSLRFRVRLRLSAWSRHHPGHQRIVAAPGWLLSPQPPSRQARPAGHFPPARMKSFLPFILGRYHPGGRQSKGCPPRPSGHRPPQRPPSSLPPPLRRALSHGSLPSFRPDGNSPGTFCPIRVLSLPISRPCT